jgi:protein-disulfide isomerase
MAKGYTKPKTQSSGPKTLVVVTLVVVLLLVGLFILNKMTASVDRNAALQNQPSLENQPVMGKPDAPVTIIEFGDYKCPSCKAWGEQVFPQLEKDFIDTGKAKFGYINVLFHGEESRLGSLAGESVFAQNKDAYWSFHKQLFDVQPRENHDAPWLTVEAILKAAQPYSSRIDMKKLEEDVKGQKTLPQVNLDSQLVEKYKIKQTPTIMIDGIMVKNPFDYKEISALINGK